MTSTRNLIIFIYTFNEIYLQFRKLKIQKEKLKFIFIFTLFTLNRIYIFQSDFAYLLFNKSLVEPVVLFYLFGPNNPIESFNKLVKLVFTNYYVTTIYELLEGLRDKLIFKLSSFP